MELNVIDIIGHKVKSNCFTPLC